MRGDESRYAVDCCEPPPTLLPALNFNVTFSEMVVVALSGPAGLPFSTPNFAHFALSATA